MKIFEVTLAERGRFEGDISQPGMYQGYIKVDKNDTRDVNGEPHAAVISVDKGWKSYQPVAEDGAVIWISKWVKGRNWVFSQLHDNGLEFSQALGGRYTRHNGRWMTKTAFDKYQDEARAGDSADEDTAMQAGIEKVEAAGVDWEAELRKARQGNVPDSRIEDEGQLLNYFLQKQGEPFWDEDVNFRGGDILWNPDDDGYTYVDTSIFISAKDREAESDARDSGESNGQEPEGDPTTDPQGREDSPSPEFTSPEALARQGQRDVERISGAGTRAVDSNVRSVADDIEDLKKMSGI